MTFLRAFPFAAVAVYLHSQALLIAVFALLSSLVAVLAHADPAPFSWLVVARPRLVAAAPALLSRVAAVPAALFHLATSVLSRLAAAPLAFGLRTLR